METTTPPPPASTASSQASSIMKITPEIDKMMKDTCEALHDESAHGIRAIHLVAPHSSGKTTFVVPRVWDYITKEWPEAVVAYIQESQYEAKVAVKSFNEATGSKGYGIIEEDEMDAQTGHLVLTWYDHMRLVLEEKLDKNEYVTPKSPLVFIMDLQGFLTVRDQVFIGLFLEYLSRLPRHYEDHYDPESGDYLDITIITLAVEEAPYIYEWFNERFGLEIKKIVAAPPQPAVQRNTVLRQALCQEIEAMRTRQPKEQLLVVK